MTISELRKLIQNLPDDMLVAVQGFENFSLEAEGKVFPIILNQYPEEVDIQEYEVYRAEWEYDTTEKPFSVFALYMKTS